MVFGVPLWLARATGWSHVVSSRVILAVGVASIVGLVRHLALSASDEGRTKVFFPIAAAIVAILLFGCLWVANRHLGNFANRVEVMAAAIFFATAFVLIWKRFAIASCILLLAPSLYANGLVNPISRGLPGITKSRVYRWFATVHRHDPGAPWLVVGEENDRSCSLGQYIEATGADVVGSTRCMPDRQMIAVLDPKNRFANVHNRYARICFIASNEAEPVFKLIATDNYRVLLPVRTEWLERLGVGYVVAVDQPNLPALEGFERVDEQRGFVLLRRVSR
jgi:heme/copper-type cytochrome/quinol oxidase subunit 4